MKKNPWLKKKVVNPIMAFSDDDVVIWGKKTLERPRKIHHINVARLTPKECEELINNMRRYYSEFTEDNK